MILREGSVCLVLSESVDVDSSADVGNVTSKPISKVDDSNSGGDVPTRNARPRSRRKVKVKNSVRSESQDVKRNAVE